MSTLPTGGCGWKNRTPTPKPGPRPGRLPGPKGAGMPGLQRASLCAPAQRGTFHHKLCTGREPDKIAMRAPESRPHVPGGPAQEPQTPRPGAGPGRGSANSFHCSPSLRGHVRLLSPLVGRGALARSCCSGAGSREEGAAAKGVTPARSPTSPRPGPSSRTSIRSLSATISSSPATGVKKTQFGAVPKGAGPKSNIKRGLN